jgi:hypothetical protein
MPSLRYGATFAAKTVKWGLDLAAASLFDAGAGLLVCLRRAERWRFFMIDRRLDLDMGDDLLDPGHGKAHHAAGEQSAENDGKQPISLRNFGRGALLSSSLSRRQASCGPGIGLAVSL